MGPDRRRLAAVVGAVLIIAGSGCSRNQPATESQPESARLVVVSPAAAEILAELDLSDRIVGVGDFVRRPAALSRLPRVGSYNAPNVEKVLELEADLLVTVRSEAAAASNARLQDLGVEILQLDTSNWAGTRQAVHELGRRLNRTEAARHVLTKLDRAMARIRERAAGSDRPGVLFVVGRDPLYVAGPGSHIDEMITAAGGRNVATDSGSPYRMVSLEAMLERSPDVIIDTSDNGPDALRGRLPGVWNRWDFLPAVRENQVFWIDPDLLVIPGIRLPAMTERVGRLIHPEIFGEPAMDDFVSPRNRGALETTIEDSP